jgi:hypothetical protein
MSRAVLVALLLSACSRPSPCERAVHHVLTLSTHAGPPGTEPKADAQRAIDQIEKLTVASCEKEGLSEAQLACIEGMTSFDDMHRITACPAIAAKKPSWLIVPPAS